VLSPLNVIPKKKSLACPTNPLYPRALLIDSKSWVGFDGVGILGGVAISCYEMGLKILLVQKNLCLTLVARVGFETLRLHKIFFGLFPLHEVIRFLVK
jgi:hypothetical protein